MPQLSREDRCEVLRLSREDRCEVLRLSLEGLNLAQQKDPELNVAQIFASPVVAQHTIVGDDILDPGIHIVATSAPVDIDAGPQSPEPK